LTSSCASSDLSPYPTSASYEHFDILQNSLHN
jgi:hypothetical protein